TIVLTSSSGSNYATAAIDNGATVNITAPSSGSTKGLAIMQDRRASTSAGSNSFVGGSATNIAGALYFPSQLVSFQNGATTVVCLQLIAWRITYTGGAKFADGCNGFGVTEIGSSMPGLVE